MDFKAPKFKKGDMVRWHYEPEKSLGIVLEQDAGKVKVHWVVSPRLRQFSALQRGRPEAWYPIYKVQRVEPTERRASED